MKYTLTKDDLFLLSMGGWGEGCGEREFLLTWEALNIDPNKMFEFVSHGCGKYFESFKIISKTKCSFTVRFDDILLAAKNRGLVICRDPLPDLNLIKEEYLEGVAQDTLEGLDI